MPPLFHGAYEPTRVRILQFVHSSIHQRTYSTSILSVPSEECCEPGRLSFLNILSPLQVLFHLCFCLFNTMSSDRLDRTPSVSSSVTEADAFDEDEKTGGTASSDGGFVNLKSPDEMETGDDVERAELLPSGQEKAPEAKPETSARTAAAWMVVNTLATIGIVSELPRAFLPIC
jgi:hypothetical protein